MKKILVYLVAWFHHCVAAGLVLAPVLCIIYQPWYLGLLSTVFVVRVMTSRDTCVLTELERSLRLKIGEPLNKSYVYHYFIAPFKKEGK